LRFGFASGMATGDFAFGLATGDFAFGVAGSC
jgi:hypothetical protein